ncbi:MAG: hypothetical protein WCO60_06935 [Verrucomicrobiota bacterium]
MMIKSKNRVDGVYGGNQVSMLVMDGIAIKSFANGVYDYFICQLESGSMFPISGLASYTLFLLSVTDGAVLTVTQGGFSERLMCSDIVKVENSTVSVSLDKGTARILVAGTKESLKSEPSIQYVKNSEVKKVVKPWGHELWFSGEGATYAFKEIAIRRGTKTSLQYHLLKKETNVLFQGSVLLHYKNNEAIDNDNVATSDVSTLELHAIASIDVSPPTLHRLESLTDVVLYEVSTPHLDDVIRVSDDTSRVHGRIDAEHTPGK